MTLQISEKANPNYLAKVVQFNNLRKHSNADRLQIATIDCNNVIVGLEAKDGDLYVFFPLESSISSDFLSFTNSFRISELNQDKETIGFFEAHGRVRAVNLRGEKSCGYACPVSKVNEWLKYKQINFEITETHVGTEFDTICDILICEKYINKAIIQKMLSSNKSRKGAAKLARENKLIEGQFSFHVDTEHLQKNIYKIDPDDIIHISQKLHGTSAISSKALCKRKLNLKERIAKFFGVDVKDSEYQLIWSSRKVVKNGMYYFSLYETIAKHVWHRITNPDHFLNDIFQATKTPKTTYKNLKSWAQLILNPPERNHYYEYDLWKDVALKYEDYLTEGMTFYSEVVGYLKTGAMIQKGYDYGCEVGEFESYIYRITYTNPSGKVFEFSTQQVKEYCQKMGIKMVPELYWGRAKDLFDIPLDDNWNIDFLHLISDTYLEKDCNMCINKVPDEGVVLRKEALTIEPYKYRSFAFCLRETKNADKGEVDIETIESGSIEDE
jgi:hypothetical protein